MKPTTMIWYQFESVGQPRHTLKGQDTVGQALTILARWTLSVYMGAKIRVTFARDEIDLAPDRRTAGKHHDIMSDLESILSGSDANTEHRETLCADEQCELAEPHIVGTHGCRWDK